MSAAITAPLLVVMMLVQTAAASATAQSGPGKTSAARSACSLITSQEIAGIVGTRIRDGEPQTVSEGTECRFRSSNSEWVNIALGSTDAKAFAQLRKLLGNQAEIQEGVGDEALFWGNVRIHVRVGTQTLIIGFARNDQGDATTKAKILALAKLGAQRLR